VIQITGDVDGFENFNRGFIRIEEFISDFRFIWPSVIETFYAIEHEQFETQGASGATGQWKQLKPSTLSTKEKHYPGKPILQRESKLFESLTTPDANDSIIRIGKLDLTIGTQREGAVFHQRGGKNLPKREPISLSDASKLRLQKDGIQRPLVDFIRRQGFAVA
jgi:phage gpG-like protein